MEKEKFVERRRYARFEVGTKVNYRIGKKQKKASLEKVKAVSKNMSVEGICFQSNEEITAGTQIELEVFLSGEPEPLLLRGEVRWSRSIEPKDAKPLFEIGVRLFTFDQSNESSYLHYVCDKMTERLRRHLELGQ